MQHHKGVEPPTLEKPLRSKVTPTNTRTAAAWATSQAMHAIKEPQMQDTCGERPTGDKSLALVRVVILCTGLRFCALLLPCFVHFSGFLQVMKEVRTQKQLLFHAHFSAFLVQVLACSYLTPLRRLCFSSSVCVCSCARILGMPTTSTRLERTVRRSMTSFSSVDSAGGQASGRRGGLRLARERGPQASSLMLAGLPVFLVLN